jgi:SAM-dependent methyltransferase
MTLPNGHHARVPAVNDHWENVHASNSSSDVSWYQRSPTTSIRFITAAVKSTASPVVDIGSGASLLIDHLLAEGLTDLTILDVSAHALDEVRLRLGDKARSVTFVHEDVRVWRPERRYAVWHDRAVFHFLTDLDDRKQYIETMRRALRDDGTAVIGTFAEDGPTQCSGLPVSRYSAADLDVAFSTLFSPIEHLTEEHVTPDGIVQPFTWGVFRRL